MDLIKSSFYFHIAIHFRIKHKRLLFNVFNIKLFYMLSYINY